MVKKLTNNANKQLLDAAEKGNLDEVKKAFKAGADINAKNEFFNQTALHLAASKGYLDIINFLLDQKADPLLKDGVDMIPLHLAARDGQTEAVRLLTKRVKNVSNRILNDVISVASMSATGNRIIVQLLYKYQMEITPPSTEELNKIDAKLIVGAFNGELDEVKKALEEGAHIDVEEDRQHTALRFASRRGHFDIVKYLVEKGADIHKSNYSKWNALMEACMAGHMEITKYLVEKGAKINAGTHVGATCLMFAAGEGHFEIVKYLIEKGADPSLAITDGDDEGMTALHYAMLNRHQDVIDFLQKIIKR